MADEAQDERKVYFDDEQWVEFAETVAPMSLPQLKQASAFSLFLADDKRTKKYLKWAVKSVDAWHVRDTEADTEDVWLDGKPVPEQVLRADAKVIRWIFQNLTRLVFELPLVFSKPSPKTDTPQAPESHTSSSSDASAISIKV